MTYLNFSSHYDTQPKTLIPNHPCFRGYQQIAQQLKTQLTDECLIAFDYYPGVDEDEVEQLIALLQPNLVIHTTEVFQSKQTIQQQLKYHITDDRTFGKMYFGDFSDFIDKSALQKAQEKIKQTKGVKIIAGVAASCIATPDLLVYFDMARWEIQLRYRKGMTNWMADNENEETLRKNKRGYFIEWRLADKHKAALFDQMDFVIDTNQKNDPKMITGETFRHSLTVLARRPFRTVPYFDPGVWGGQWMKEVCHLAENGSNYAWSFDGVPEENSILFEYDQDCVFELPAMDLVLYQPKPLLGEKVYARFGAEYPIRFDFLDTMEGQNLSLQVHPLTEYIKKQFGMAYTQDESYYILDAKEDACVYLGLKTGINKDEMLNDLQRAQKNEIIFDAEKYVNKFPAKKHDHFLIPAGTVHCSGANTMVLEISSTPYIFTFKLWDWARVGLDGLPRPINIAHGKHVIQWDRTTEWVEENLVNATYLIQDDQCQADQIEHTGLHELEFIETIRYTVSQKTYHHTKGNLNMLNLIDGQQAIVRSTEERFEPFIVHYAETFIIPASVGSYTIEPYEQGQTVKVIKAFVR